jgi:hypothetical protein
LSASGFMAPMPCSALTLPSCLATYNKTYKLELVACMGQNAAVMEYQQSSQMCKTILLTGRSMFIIITIVLHRRRSSGRPSLESGEIRKMSCTSS